MSGPPAAAPAPSPPPQKEIKVVDIRGFFGGARSTSIVPTGKTSKTKDKKEETAAASASPSSGSATSAAAAASPSPAVGKKAAAGSAPAPAPAPRRALVVADDDDDAGAGGAAPPPAPAPRGATDDDDGVLTREGGARGSRDADDGGAGERIGDLKAAKARAAAAAASAAPGTPPRSSAAAAAPAAPPASRVAVALHEKAADVSAAAFFGGAVVTKGASPARADAPASASRRTKPASAARAGSAATGGGGNDAAEDDPDVLDLGAAMPTHTAAAGASGKKPGKGKKGKAAAVVAAPAPTAHGGEVTVLDDDLDDEALAAALAAEEERAASQRAAASAAEEEASLRLIRELAEAEDARAARSSPAKREGGGKGRLRRSGGGAGSDDSESAGDDSESEFSGSEESEDVALDVGDDDDEDFATGRVLSKPKPKPKVKAVKPASSAAPGAAAKASGSGKTSSAKKPRSKKDIGIVITPHATAPAGKDGTPAAKRARTEDGGAAAASRHGSGPASAVKPALPVAVAAELAGTSMDLNAPIVTGSRVPKGSPTALAGTKWVITGELHDLTRESATAAIVRHGGAVVSAVSGKVNHLLVGHTLEDGREVTSSSKYREALEQCAKGNTIRIVDEDAFFRLLDESLPPSERQFAADGDVAMAGVTAKAPTAVAPRPVAARASSAMDLDEPATTAIATAAASAGSGSGSGSGSSSGSGGSAPVADELWVDKYKPRTFEDLVGNGKDLLALDAWLKAWDGLHLAGDGDDKVKAKAGSSMCKAALISGPPGIGKTTTAMLLARRYHYDPLEMNASDARSKNRLKEDLEPVTGNSTMRSFFSTSGAAGAASEGSGSAAASSSAAAAAAAPTRRRLIIMDEVDGMSSGDRGGNGELCRIIRETRTPIICICNDRQKPAVRTLAQYCFDVKFQLPAKELIARRLAKIAAAEGLTVDAEALSNLVESCGFDLRACLNTMQMWAISAKHMSTSALKSRMGTMSKDLLLRLDANTATPKLFNEGRTATLDTRIEYFFVDYDMIPLLVQEMYPGSISNAPGLTDAVRVRRLTMVADAVSDSDIYCDYVRGRQAWGLLPSMAIANVRAAGWAAGVPPPVFFPKYLGRNSSRTKRARLLAEMALHMAAFVSGGREAVRLDYFEGLRAHAFAPLLAPSAASDPAAAVDTAIARLDEYGLTRDDLMVTMGEEVVLEGDPASRDYAKAVESKLKAAFTREYNKRGHPRATAVPAGAVSSMRGGRKSGGGGGGLRSLHVSEDGEEVDDDDEDDEGEGDDDKADGDEESPAAGAGIGRGRGRGRGRAAASAASGRGRGRGGAASKPAGAASTRGRGRGAKGTAATRGRGGAAPAVGTKRKRAASESDEGDDDDDDLGGFIVDDDDIDDD